MKKKARRIKKTTRKKSKVKKRGKKYEWKKKVKTGL